MSVSFHWRYRILMQYSAKVFQMKQFNIIRVILLTVKGLPNDRQHRGCQKTHYRRNAHQLAAVFERFRHHRIGQHGQHRSSGESLGNLSICFWQPADDQVAQPCTGSRDDHQRRPHPEDGASRAAGRFEIDRPSHTFRQVRDEHGRQKGEVDRAAQARLMPRMIDSGTLSSSVPMKMAEPEPPA